MKRTFPELRKESWTFVNNQRIFFILPLLLLLCLSLPQHVTDRIRSKIVATFPATTQNDVQELSTLRLENYQLRTQLDLVYEWLGSEKRIREQADLYRQINVSNDFLARRSDEMKRLLQKQTMAAFARVVHRDPSSWSSTCWIDVGEENNLSLGQKIIAKNSPVVFGSALVGVVEYVGKKQSRVRFITDSGLKTAVRAIRGSVLDREIASSAHSLLDKMKKHPHPDPQAIDLLSHLALPVRWEDTFLAKGELCGSSATYFRSLSSTLKGMGFNCDFKDPESPSRYLRSDILKPGDLLITSGLDGVFPPGLKVAIVTKIEPLQAGAFSYDLEATPLAQDLADLTSVYVLPPVAME
jgi:rod shape-determining protein MreC